MYAAAKVLHFFDIHKKIAEKKTTYLLRRVVHKVQNMKKLRRSKHTVERYDADRSRCAGNGLSYGDGYPAGCRQVAEVVRIIRRTRIAME